MKVINGTNILLDGSIDVSNTDKYISQEEFESRYRHFAIDEGDIVLSSSGTLGKVGRIKAEHLPLMMNTSVIRFRSKDPAILDDGYIFVYLRSPLFQATVRSYAVGGVQQNFGPVHLKQIELNLPPIAVQRRIASILSSYDDLIENNRKRIKLLERAARLLYKEWFVRLRFPGCEGVEVVQSELGSIPAKWKVTPLGELCTKIGSGSTPRGGEAAYKEEGVTLVRSQNVYDFAFTMDGLAYIDDEQAADLDGVTLQANDILLNITGASVGRCCMMPSRLLPGRVNQHVMIIRADAEKNSPAYLLCVLNSPARKAQLLSLAQGKGATREALTKSSMEQFKIVVPEEATWKAFAAKVEPMFELRETLDAQNAALTRARDLLLPRLMSGKVKV